MHSEMEETVLRPSITCGEDFVCVASGLNIWSSTYLPLILKLFGSTSVTCDGEFSVNLFLRWVSSPEQCGRPVRSGGNIVAVRTVAGGCGGRDVGVLDVQPQEERLDIRSGIKQCLENL